MNERQRAGAERHLDGTARPRAFILTGALAVVCRDPIYIDDLRRRDLKVLVITAAAWHGYAEAHRDDPAHPASAIEEVAFVDGSVESEGSFLPGVIEHAGRWREKYDVVGIYAVGRRWSSRPAWSPTTSTSRSRGCGRRAPAGASTSSAGIYPISARHPC